MLDVHTPTKVWGRRGGRNISCRVSINKKHKLHKGKLSTEMSTLDMSAICGWLQGYSLMYTTHVWVGSRGTFYVEFVVVLGSSW